MVFIMLIWWYEKTNAVFIGEKDCIEKFCKDLKELGKEMINFKKKEMIPLTNKELSLMKSKKYVIYVKKRFCDDKN